MAQTVKSKPANVEMLTWNPWTMEASDISLAQKIRRLSCPQAQRTGRPMLVYLGLSLLVMLPLLLHGYILTLDMAFTSHIRMPEEMSSSYLFYGLLHVLSFVIPSEILQKLVLLSILFLSGLGMHLLMRHVQNAKLNANEYALWGAYIAGALYMINPFTYSRFMAGQFAVLLGYALLPFFVRSLIVFFNVPTLQRSLNTSGWAALISIVSVHTLGPAALVTALGTAVYVWWHRRNRGIAVATVALVAAGVVLFVAASSYWLFPLLDGTSNQGRAAAQFTTHDQQAFATAGGTVIGKLGNVLQLQGFWAEAEGLFLLPQEQLPGWALVVLGFWTLVGIGAVQLWRNNRAPAILLTSSAVAATTIAITGIGSWLPWLAGFREPHKFVMLVALAFAVCAGCGAAAAFEWAKKRGKIVFAVIGVCVLTLPILYTPTMAWGFSGQLSPREYPADWYAINEQLNRDPTNFRVLSLPWHLYMHYQFAGRVIVNPSENFFDKPTLASNELEFKHASPTFPDPDKRLLSTHIVPRAATDPNFGEELDSLNIKYVLLAKTYDYKSYEYLDKRPDLQLVTETQNLKLYRNLSYGK